MNYVDAMNIRRSRRSYLDTPIAPEKLNHLKLLIDDYNEKGNLSIRLIEDGSKAFSFGKDYGMFSGVKTLIAMIGKSTDENNREKVGYYGELLVLEATNMDLGTCWVGGSFDRNSDIFKIAEDESLIAVIPIGNVENESGLKEKLIRKLIHRNTKQVQELYSAETEVPSWFIEGLKAVQKAPSAINRQPVKFEYREGVVTAHVDNPDGFEFIDLGIAKLHFSLIAQGDFELGNYGEFRKRPD